MDKLVDSLRSGKLQRKWFGIGAFVILINGLMFHSVGSTGLAVFLGLLGALVVIVFGSGMRANMKLTVGILIGVGVVSLINLVRVDNHMLALLSGGLALGSVGLLTYSLLSDGFPRSLAEVVMAPITLVVAYFQSGLRMAKLVLAGDVSEILVNRGNERKSVMASVGLGLLVALPVMGVLVFLLAGGDPVFGKLVEKFFSFGDLSEVPARVIISGVVLVGLAPMILMVIKDKFQSPVHKILGRTSFSIEMTVVMGVVAMIFGIFLVVQWPYVFARVPAETDLVEFGVKTYSEYVRRGFGELLVAGLLVYLLCGMGLIIWRGNQKDQVLRWVQILNLGLISVFLMSVARRIWLYQAYHGLSLVRIYGGIFLVWLLGMVVFLTLRHFWAKRWVVAEVIFTVALVIGAGWMNPDGYLAAYHPPTVNGRVDYVYLAALSADGYEGWKKALVYAESVVDKDFENMAIIGREDRREIVYAGWVTQILTGKYFDLMGKYGQEADVRRIQDKMSGKGILGAGELIGYRMYGGSRSWPWRYGLFEAQMDDWSLFYIREWENKKVLPKWDQMLSWNGSEAAAFNQMKDNRWDERLVDAQSRFVEVLRLVRRQPVSERDYEVDISTGPFLEW